MTIFARYVGIDYSGAETPTASLKGLRVYRAEAEGLLWRRRHRRLRGSIGPEGPPEWLVEYLPEDAPTLVGIDHAFSFPKRYFKEHGLTLDWPRSWTTSNFIGRQTRITSMSISSGTASRVKAQTASGILDGDA